MNYTLNKNSYDFFLIYNLKRIYEIIKYLKSITNFNNIQESIFQKKTMKNFYNRKELVNKALEIVDTQNLDLRIINCLKEGMIGIEALISCVNINLRKELENAIFKIAGEDRNEDYYSYIIGSSTEEELRTPQKLEVQRAIFDVNNDFFSPRKIKIHIAALERKGILKRESWSENQKRIGNYNISLLNEPS